MLKTEKNIINGINRASVNVANKKKRACFIKDVTVSDETLNKILAKVPCPQCECSLEYVLSGTSFLNTSFDVVCENCHENVISQRSKVFKVKEGNKTRKYYKKLIGAVYGSMLDGSGWAESNKHTIHIGKVM